MKKILITISVIFVILICIITTDVVLVKLLNKNPIFTIKTKDYYNGKIKIYNGLGYKVISYNYKNKLGELEPGRHDKEIGFYNLQIQEEPISYESVNVAIDLKDKRKNIKNKILNSYIRITGEVIKVDLEKNSLTLGYVDKGGKYNVSFECKMANKTSKIENFKTKDIVTAIGKVKKYKNKKDIPTFYMIDVFAEKEEYEK